MFRYPFKLIKPLHLLIFLVLCPGAPCFIMGRGAEINTFLLARYFPLYICPIFFIYVNRKVGVLDRESGLLIQRVGRTRFVIMSTLSIYVEAVVFFLSFLCIRYLVGGLETASLYKLGMIVLLRFVVFILGVALILRQAGKESQMGYMLAAFLLCIISQFFLVEGIFFDYFLVF